MAGLDAICPRCGSEELYQKSGGVKGRSSALYVEIGKLFRHARLDAWLCMVCGYVAVGLPEQGIEAVRQVLEQKGWAPVAGSPRGPEGQILARHPTGDTSDEVTMTFDPGVCAMCGSSEVYWKNSGVLASRSSVYIQTSFFGFTFLDAYLCLDCGYVALRVPAGHMREVRRTLDKTGWKQVSAKDSSDR